MFIRRIVTLGLLSLLIFSMTVAVQAQADSELQVITHNDTSRSYRLYVPETNPDKLLIVLHPFASNGRAMEIITGFNTLADSHGFAVAYPNSLDYYWDSGRSSGSIPPLDGAIDDIGFLATLADEITANLGIATGNVYLTGINNGGEMAYLAACTSPERYKAVAVVSTLIVSYQADACPQTQSAPINMLMVWGDSDHYFTGEHYDVDAGRTIFSTQESLDFWINRNGCDIADIETQLANVEQFACEDDTSTTFIRIQGGGNVWHRMAGNQLNRVGIDASTLLAEYFSQSDDWLDEAQQPSMLTMIPRSWLMYVPDSYIPSEAIPVVLLLHGRTANGASQAWTSDFNSIAEREGVIAIYPDGLEAEWNYTRPPESGLNENLPDDETFLGTLLDDLALDLNIDASRIYVTGYSNGGFMAQRMACTMQDRIVAFASVAATGAYGLPVVCLNRDAVPAMYIQGTADRIVPWEGTEIADSAGNPITVSAPMSRTISFWADHNGCSSELDISDIPQTTDETQTRVLYVADCPVDAPVVTFMVINGGHTWQGVRGNSDFLGLSSADFNASEVIWDFFTHFSLD